MKALTTILPPQKTRRFSQDLWFFISCLWVFFFFILMTGPAAAGLVDDTDNRMPAETAVSYRLAAGDIDNDGDTDLLAANNGQAALLVNDGDGFFSDESAARLPGPTGSTLDAVFGDVDNDSDLDLVLVLPFGRNRLYINDGSGTFTDENRHPSAESSRNKYGCIPGRY